MIAVIRSSGTRFSVLTHLSRRFMFWVNVPFCVVGLVLAARFMPGDAPTSVRHEKSPASTYPAWS